MRLVLVHAQERGLDVEVAGLVTGGPPDQVSVLIREVPIFKS